MSKKKKFDMPINVAFTTKQESKKKKYEPLLNKKVMEESTNRLNISVGLNDDELALVVTALAVTSSVLLENAKGLNVIRAKAEKNIVLARKLDFILQGRAYVGITEGE